MMTWNLMLVQLFMQAMQEVPTLIDDAKSMITAVSQGKGGIGKIENVAKAFSQLADHASIVISDAGSAMGSATGSVAVPVEARALATAVASPQHVVDNAPPASPQRVGDNALPVTAPGDAADNPIPGLDQAPKTLPAGSSGTVSQPAAVVSPPGSQTLAPAGVDPSRWASFQAWSAANPTPPSPSADPTDTRNIADKLA